ncbi:glucose-1-phosphate adenylyltransferase family protein [Tessaracoccus flavus]|uniref:Glucose-1-phosphate adenylyltransferase n=1 Tax=Tessaracoccus flavus TaxID=1610493 RepID=A0A1Q2CHT1_9ACTN|nr:sugar phosphate nucleotidyltransferase [Tessaracoccus flavus]AQP45615.1 glucose-1-phosphate adenylyltransferase [Tessaracoccus flavus]SDY77277.1 glucose-1-phosphate adenylyltransferase [Tessaracoccus flavus]
MHIPRTYALILAGGEGSRLEGLTDAKPKPVLPVGGTFRLIDISLSNLAQSHLSDIGIVEQYLPHSLNTYLSAGRPWDLDRNHGGLEVLAPFEGGPGEGFAKGNADSIYRQREVIRAFDPEYVLVLSADHLYTMNFLDVLSTHIEKEADLTIVTTLVDEDPSRYGVVQVDDAGTVTRFDYKPDDPEGRLVATEVFVYTASQLLAALEELTADGGELEDYGDQLIPWFVEHRKVVEHRHDDYWLDLGTLQSYWTANLQILDGNGVVLDDPRWRIYSALPQLPPARVMGGAEVHDSLLSSGSVVEGEVRHSVIGSAAIIEAGATVVDSVVLDGARIGPGVSLVNCIVDEGAQVTGGSQRGTGDTVTLIGDDGLIDTRQPLDPEAALPRGFPR